MHKHCVPLCALDLSFGLELNKVDGFVDMLLFFFFIFQNIHAAQL